MAMCPVESTRFETMAGLDLELRHAAQFEGEFRRYGVHSILDRRLRHIVHPGGCDEELTEGGEVLYIDEAEGSLNLSLKGAVLQPGQRIPAHRRDDHHEAADQLLEVGLGEGLLAEQNRFRKLRLGSLEFGQDINEIVHSLLGETLTHSDDVKSAQVDEGASNPLVHGPKGTNEELIDLRIARAPQLKSNRTSAAPDLHLEVRRRHGDGLTVVAESEDCDFLTFREFLTQCRNLQAHNQENK